MPLNVYTLADASHELKTPLTAIAGMAELLEEAIRPCTCGSNLPWAQCSGDEELGWAYCG